MQVVFPYDYGNQRDAIKQAKKLRSGAVYVCVIQHPKSGRYKVLEGESIDDRPTRVPVLWEYHDPPKAPSQRAMDRDNLVWLANEILNDGDTHNKLANAIIEYLENYDA